MLIRISNIGDAMVLLQQHGAPDLELPRGRSVVIEDAVLVAEGAAPVAVAPAIASSVPPEGIARSPAAPPPVVLPDGFIAGSDSGGPGHPIDPVPIKERPEPPRAHVGGVADDPTWDPNRGIVGMPPPKRSLFNNVG